MGRPGQIFNEPLAVTVGVLAVVVILTTVGVDVPLHPLVVARTV